jgi:DNA transposition AAA+ family ATPase
MATELLSSPAEHPSNTVLNEMRISPRETIVAAHEAANSIKFRIPADVIQRTVADLPDRERVAIKWFAGYCRTRNIGSDECGQLLQQADGRRTYSGDSIYQLLTGRRHKMGVDVTPMIESIERFRAQVEGTKRDEDTDFIETRLSRGIWDRCARALKTHRIAPIFGRSQIGKSRALREYARRHNHGETIFVEMPAGGKPCDFRHELVRALGLPIGMREADSRRRIIDSIDSRMLIIVDEAHRCLQKTGGHAGLCTLEFIREIYNRCGCGIVISMTDEGRQLLLHGPHAVALQQLWRRRITPLQLPTAVPLDDLHLFAASHNLEPAPDKEVAIDFPYFDERGQKHKKVYKDNPQKLQLRVSSEEGLGVWLSILGDAREMAEEQKKGITWGAVLKAYCVSQADAEVWR